MRTLLMNKYIMCILFLFTFLVTGCKDEIIDSNLNSPANNCSSEVPAAWYSLELKLVKETKGITPPISARAFGYTGIALYEAIYSEFSGRRSLAGQLNGLTELEKPSGTLRYDCNIVSNTVLAEIIRKLFPNASEENRAAIDRLEEDNNMTYETDEAVMDRSKLRGKTIAERIFEWSKTDGGNEAFLRNFPNDYVPPSGPGMWVPTGATGALLPYWGENRPYLPSTRSVPIPPPTAYSEIPGSQFYNEAFEVYNTVKSLTEEQKNIALFWSDDPGKTYTPAGHFISILNQVIKKENPPIDKAAECYAKVGIALNDAFICCWKSKYMFSLLRPVTYIRKNIDNTWSPLLVTPSFPEYTSGHSVQSAAAATILTGIFGPSYGFVDHTHDYNGLQPREYNSFMEAASEAAISRLYGGIHFRPAIITGMELGKKIAEGIDNLRFY